MDSAVLVSEHRIICKFECLSQAGLVAISYPGKGLFLGWTGNVLVYINGDEDRPPGATGPERARS